MSVSDHRRTITTAATAVVTMMLTATGASAYAEPPSANTAASASVEPGELVELAENYLQKRADMLTSVHPTPRSASARLGATRAMASGVQEELAALGEKGQRYREVDGGYTRAEVEVETSSAELNERTATLRLTEHTRLYLPMTRQEVEDGAPEYEESSLARTMTFTRNADDEWLLSSDEVEAGGGPTPTTQATGLNLVDDDGGGTPDEDEGSKGSASDTAALPENGIEYIKPAVTASYNYSKMVSYANKYWKKHNSAYRTYGNDCTNFISQAVHAGGWGPKGGALIQRKSNKYWFYGPAKPLTSYTWAGAENWYWFAKKHSKRTKPLDNVWKMASADVLQADFDRNGKIDHTMIVTKKYKGTPYLTYHTTDTHNKSLKKILSDYPRALWYAHRT
ncbi:amidase domain-containing protein [Streptomyces rubiginosohelvolus]|uniref:amidase domain-containing protein n=1 Tax=Streptomyces rubiginosohelvolus TaxID=67362 RepID=UPI00365A7447